MVSLIEFLKHVLPTEGVKCWLALRKSDAGKSLRKQGFCDTLEQLEAALRKYNAEGWNVYTACAAFNSDESREQSNAMGTKAFWLDIDAGPGKPYENADAALAALDHFCGQVGLVLPTVLFSGNGVHAWWALDEMLPAYLWPKVAGVFKKLTEKHGLHADPSRTADISSVLRVPETYNRKGTENPKLVVCEEMEPVTTIKELCGVLKRNNFGQPAPMLPATTVDIGKASINIYQSAEPSFAFRAVDHCAQLRHMRDMVGNIEEPLWYASLCVLAHCEDGRKAAHDWSCGHPSYTYEETEEKLAHAHTASGPTTCHKFQALNAKGCEGCPHNVSSPILLGRGAVIAPVAPAILPDARPWLPFGFRWGKNMELIAVVKDELDPNKLEHVVITKHALYLAGMRRSDREKDMRGYVFRRWFPHEGWVEFEISSKDFWGASWAGVMSAHGATLDPSVHKLFRKYVIRAEEAGRDVSMDQVRHEQFGWKDDRRSFLLGNYMYSPDSTVSLAGVHKDLDLRAQLLLPQKGGSLEKWTAIASKFYRVGLEAQGFGLLASFAAPLMVFASQRDGGAIVSLVSPGSGKGKSTALDAVASVWGRLEAVQLKNNDTLVAKFGSMGRLCHLPLIYDEIETHDPLVMQQFVRTFTVGRDKDRGRRDGTISQSIGNWQTIMITASNNSILDSLTIGTADPQAARVFELLIEQPEGIEFSKSGALGDSLIANRGFAGQAYMRYVVMPSTMAWLAGPHGNDGVINNLIDHYGDKLGASSEHRYLIRILATTAAAAAIIRKMGLLEFDNNRMISWASEQMQDRIKDKTEYNAWKSVRQIINDNSQDCLVVAEKFHPKQPTTIKQMPQGRLRMRWEIGGNRLYISAESMREWLNKAHKPYTAIVNELEKSKVLISRNRMTKLGAGTTLMSMPTPCWELDVSNPSVSYELRLENLLEQPAPVTLASN